MPPVRATDELTCPVVHRYNLRVRDGRDACFDLGGQDEEVGRCRCHSPVGYGAERGQRPLQCQRRAPTVVLPTGGYPADVNNVQGALDAGGTVLLKATNASGAPTPFNFGPATRGSGFVTFHQDAQLTGERTSQAATTIKGGNAPIRAFDALSIAVRDILFDGPRLFALDFSQPPGADAVVTGNQISHVGGVPNPTSAFQPGPV